jgi:ubiquinone/menaquinone biosynthesis C-methylase UbiE
VVEVILLPMDRRHVAEVAGRYTHDAPLYERYWAPSLARLGQRLVAGLPLEDASVVVDIGAGVGALLPAFREAAPRAYVAGVDASEGMLRRAPPSFGRALMDAGQLALRDESVDAATMSFVLFFLHQPRRGLDEVLRALKPGGGVGVSTWDAGTYDYPAEKVWYELLEEHGAAVEEAQAHPELMDTPEKLSGLLRDAGFVEVHTDITREPAPVTLEEYLEVRTGIGRSRARFESLAPETRTKMLAAARERLAELEPEDFTDPQVAVFAWGSKPG